MSSGYWRRGKCGWSWKVNNQDRPEPEEGYSFQEASETVNEGLAKAGEHYKTLPRSLAAAGFVLIELVRHPLRLGTGNFPRTLIKTLSLGPVEILKGLVTARSSLGSGQDPGGPRPTQRLVVAVRRKLIGRCQIKIARLDPQSREAKELGCLEKVRTYDPQRLLAAGELPQKGELPQQGESPWPDDFAFSLYRIPGSSRYAQDGFASAARKMGFELQGIWTKGRPVSFPGHPRDFTLEGCFRGLRSDIGELARFSLLESVRFMEKAPKAVLTRNP
jgi:hypothetical protein